jgi:hypothetical protein
MSEAYVQAANTMIGDKILYASAHPFVDFRQALKTYEQLASPEVRQKILYDKAARLLGLEARPAAQRPLEGEVLRETVTAIVKEVLTRFQQ